MQYAQNSWMNPTMLQSVMKRMKSSHHEDKTSPDHCITHRETKPLLNFKTKQSNKITCKTTARVWIRSNVTSHNDGLTTHHLTVKCSTTIVNQSDGSGSTSTLQPLLPCFMEDDKIQQSNNRRIHSGQCKLIKFHGEVTFCLRSESTTVMTPTHWTWNVKRRNLTLSSINVYMATAATAGTNTALNV